jgi:phenylacetate-CoA ligase
LITEKCSCGRTAYRLAGIAGRVGDAVKVRGLFIAPSQLKMISAKFNNLPLQAIVSRKGHEDVLTLRLEKVNQETGSAIWDNNFKKIFKEICTVKIDEIQYVEAGLITPDQKLILDQRQW